MNPKVFLCHAGDDNMRFVNEFAKTLRENHGINVWSSDWEMLPGDSLVDKIFNEGIKNADAMIIVISKNSINKKWVKEELNAGFVKRIEGKFKLIPVIIDDCEIPEVLKTTIWQRINNLNDFKKELDTIVNSIYGYYVKPPLGDPPKYASGIISAIPGYSKEDTLILKEVCEIALERGFDGINVSKLYNIIKEKYQIPDEVFLESVELLADRYCFKAERANIGIIYVSLTTYGFDIFAKQFLDDYDDSIKKVAFCIVNSKGRVSCDSVVEDTGLNHFLVINIFDLFEERSLISQLKVRNHRLISQIKPGLKRILRNL